MKHFSLPKDGGLIEAGIPQDILHSYEHITTHIFDLQETASAKITEIIIDAVNSHSGGVPFKLGMSTGKTPVPIFRMLARAFEEGRISFRNVELFSIDEYYPFGKEMAQSRNRKLYTELIDKVDILASNVHVPDGTVPQTEVGEYCDGLDRIARNMDLVVIGIGEKGQVGFNESGASIKSRTRTVLLPYRSRKVQAKNFNGEVDATPKMAITVGIGTLMTASRVILMAFGESKAQAVKKVVECKPELSTPASCFQLHENVEMYVDETSGELLTRVESPWLIGPCEWTRKFRRKAVVWLCGQLGKPILKLSHEDYLNNSLGELVDLFGPFDKINIDIFNDLQHTITGWPGGKPDADDSTRPVSSEPFPKTVLIFSPHPDDDVISMGGTFIRLVAQGHNVHVAYETSGDLAVHDDVVLQHIDAAYELGYGDDFVNVRDIIRSKVPGEPEPKDLLSIKAAIRRSEAKGAVRSFGLNAKKNAHFLNLPFYESGGVAKFPRTQADVDIIKKLMAELQPDQIYMAGDLADPHGTHRVCTEAAMEALEQLREEGAGWVEKCHVWLYRGAWMEWELGRVDMAVPLSPEEVVQKRYAIYHHLSQKDIVPFPGDDPREFWQRAEERTSNTARLYDSLGMAEYQAMEVFLKLF